MQLSTMKSQSRDWLQGDRGRDSAKSSLLITRAQQQIEPEVGAGQLTSGTLDVTAM